MCVQKIFHKHVLGPVTDVLPSSVHRGLEVWAAALVFSGGAPGGSAGPLCCGVSVTGYTASRRLRR